MPPWRPWWPIREFSAYQLASMAIEEVERHEWPCRECDGTGQSTNRGICRVCRTEAPLETHHLAPCGLFNRPNDWPVTQICRRCHELWHEVMGHPIGRS